MVRIHSSEMNKHIILGSVRPFIYQSRVASPTLGILANCVPLQPAKTGHNQQNQRSKTSVGAVFFVGNP